MLGNFFTFDFYFNPADPTNSDPNYITLKNNGSHFEIWVNGDLYHSELASNITELMSAVSEIAALKAQLELPKGVIHVISDIHGEAKKLRHVINNASGSLRPLVKLRPPRIRGVILLCGWE